MDQMRAAGDIEPASGDLDDLPDPLVLDENMESSSQALARLRRAER